MSFLNNISNRVGSTVNDKLGDLIAGSSTNFRGSDVPLYEKFLYNILADGENSVTESSYWVVFFNEITSGDINGTFSKSKLADTGKGFIKNYLSKEFSIGEGNTKTSSINFDSSSWSTGTKTANMRSGFFNNIENTIMLVQGIEVPGDGFEVLRPESFNVGGFLRPAIGGMRNDMPEMEITFLENNSSVTDLVLRPWVITASYLSLKFAPKVNISCYNLTRSPSGFRIRKGFTFHNACPIYIDAEQYDYTAMTSYGKRQTKFVFSHYSLDDGDGLTDGFLDKTVNFAAQKIRNFTTSVVESGVDVVAGAGNQILTNIKGSLVDTFNDHTRDVQTRIREFGKDAEDSIIDKSQRFIDKSIGFNPDKDSLQGPGTEFTSGGIDNNPAPRLPVGVDSSDALTSPPIPPISSGVSNNVKYTILKTNDNDTPDTGVLNLQEVNINNIGSSVDTTKVSIPNNDNIRR